MAAGVPESDRAGRAGDGDLCRGPAPGRPGHRCLGDLRRDRRRVTGRAAQGPAGWRQGRDKLIDHVIGAETAYARKLGEISAWRAERVATGHRDHIVAQLEARVVRRHSLGAPDVTPDGYRRSDRA